MKKKIILILDTMLFIGCIAIFIIGVGLMLSSCSRDDDEFSQFSEQKIKPVVEQTVTDYMKDNSDE